MEAASTWPKYADEVATRLSHHPPCYTHFVKSVHVAAGHAIPRGRSRKVCKGWWNDELEKIQKERMAVSDSLSRLCPDGTKRVEEQIVALRSRLHVLRVDFREAVR
eukprot:320768-Amphidinium_carterae.1